VLIGWGYFSLTSKEHIFQFLDRDPYNYTVKSSAMLVLTKKIHMQSYTTFDSLRGGLAPSRKMWC